MSWVEPGQVGQGRVMQGSANSLRANGSQDREVVSSWKLAGLSGTGFSRPTGAGRGKSLKHYPYQLG